MAEQLAGPEWNGVTLSGNYYGLLRQNRVQTAKTRWRSNSREALPGRGGGPSTHRRSTLSDAQLPNGTFGGSGTGRILGALSQHQPLSERRRHTNCSLRKGTSNTPKHKLNRLLH